ncbi:uncharacterized protein LOC117645464 [Thrips palmi]|uniref:Uncharacterized protein LOC117645464 n=1 Tax=Thrips palmi TaxID=161013 RepID=A0A6P8Z4P8_THRPL|nr:uncharacterized protein LOC117645464 [Thrips palmi]
MQKMERQEGDRPENMDTGDETSTLTPQEQVQESEEMLTEERGEENEEMETDNTESATQETPAQPEEADLTESATQEAPTQPEVVDLTDEENESQEATRCGPMQDISDEEGDHTNNTASEPDSAGAPSNSGEDQTVPDSTRPGEAHSPPLRSIYHDLLTVIIPERASQVNSLLDEIERTAERLVDRSHIERHAEQVTLFRGYFDKFANALNILPYKLPDFPDMQSAEKRMETFKRWPKDIKITPEALAENGFFYTGVKDAVMCFHCGTGLGRWKESDDVAFEHATYSPYCGFLVRLLGKEYVQKVQTQLQTIDNVPLHFKNIIKPHVAQSNTTQGHCKAHDKIICKICYERGVDVVVLPCAHLFTCTLCLPSMTHCGVCRAPIRYTLRVFV